MIAPASAASGDLSMKSDMERFLGALTPDLRRAFLGYAESHTYPVHALFTELIAALPADPRPPADLAASLERLHMGLDLQANLARGFVDPRLETPFAFIAQRLVAVAAAELAFADPGAMAGVYAWKYFGAKPLDVASLDAYCLVWPEYYGRVYRLLARAVSGRFRLDERGRRALESGLAHLGTATHLAQSAAAFRQPSGLGRSGSEMLLVAILEGSTEFESKIIRKYITSLRANVQFLGDREYARIRSVAKRYGVFDRLVGRIAADTTAAAESIRSLVPAASPALTRILEYPASVNPGAAR